jgi:probable rRNA maturation factor
VGLRGEVEVLLAGDRTLRRLNREFRGKNKATDVLSFPAMAEMAGVFAGDLAVSLETAQRQAAEHGHTLRDEVRVLLLHGLLHLSGMDHEVDSGEMAEREGLLRAKLRLPSGLIARVEGDTGSFGMTNKKATAKAKAKAKADPYGMTTRKAKAKAKAKAKTIKAEAKTRAKVAA